MQEQHKYVVEMKNCRKEFPGVVAVKDVSLSLKRGESACVDWRKRSRKIHDHENAGRSSSAGWRRDSV